MRSAEAHALLAHTDVGLPALPALLDDSVLTVRLGVPVTRSYLRYKPGTSATALVDVAGRPAIASAWGGGGDKRAKALKHTAPEDILLDSPGEGLLVVDALTDRRLPALRVLVRNGRLGPWLAGAGYAVASGASPTTLVHKPARRWVGRMPLERPGRQVVLRAYTGGGYDEALAAHGLIDPERTSVRLPRVIATHRRGLIALEHLPGRVLDESISQAGLRRLGASLGELHTSGPADVIGTEHPAVTDGLGALQPVLGDVVAQVARIDTEARAALRPGAGSVVHGDFSLDQVVADGHGIGIIDLDRVRLGNPLDDIASLLAAAGLSALPDGGAGRAAAVMDRLRAPLVAGHSSTWSGALSDDLGPRTALELLARAGEPFRAGWSDWPRVTRELVALAGGLASGRAAA